MSKIMHISEYNPAFPTVNHNGMQLRDYFAAKAIRIWLEDSKLDSPFVDVDENYIAKKAYKMADAMLKAREKKD